MLNDLASMALSIARDTDLIIFLRQMGAKKLWFDHNLAHDIRAASSIDEEAMSRASVTPTHGYSTCGAEQAESGGGLPYLTYFEVKWHRTLAEAEAHCLKLNRQHAEFDRVPLTALRPLWVMFPLGFRPALALSNDENPPRSVFSAYIQWCKYALGLSPTQRPLLDWHLLPIVAT